VPERVAQEARREAGADAMLRGDVASIGLVRTYWT